MPDIRAAVITLQNLDEISKLRFTTSVSVKSDKLQRFRHAFLKSISEVSIEQPTVTSDVFDLEEEIPSSNSTHVVEVINSPVNKSPVKQTQSSIKSPAPQPKRKASAAPPRKQPKQESSISELLAQAAVAKEIVAQVFVPTSPTIKPNAVTVLSEMLLAGEWNSELRVADYMPTSPFMKPVEWMSLESNNINQKVEEQNLTKLSLDSEWDPTGNDTLESNGSTNQPVPSMGVALQTNWDPTSDMGSPTEVPSQSAEEQAEWDPTGASPTKEKPSEPEWDPTAPTSITNPEPVVSQQVEWDPTGIDSPLVSSQAAPLSTAAAEWDPTRGSSPLKEVSGDLKNNTADKLRSPTVQGNDISSNVLSSPCTEFKEIEEFPTSPLGSSKIDNNNNRLPSLEQLSSPLSQSSPSPDAVKKRKVPGQTKVPDPDLEDWKPSTGNTAISPTTTNEDNDDTSEEQDDGIQSMF